MTAIWPASLPCRPMLGIEETPKMAKSTFESDTGPAIERPKGTLRLVDMSVTYRMSADQVATFEDFVLRVLKQGSLPFYMTHPRRLSQVKVRMIGDNPYRQSEMAPNVFSISINMTVIG